MKRRTIKFRGKCCHSDAWAFGNLVDYGEDECPEIQGFDVFGEGRDVWREIEVERDTIGQFTGLHDKNGEGIYEGDILQWGEGGYKINTVVMFLHGAFGYKCDPYTFIPYVGNTNFDFWAKGTDHRFEIIGNIHDNPELQKGGEV